MMSEDIVARRTVTVRNQKGLHARASARFAERARQFKAEVAARANGEIADARSIMDLLMLAAGPGVALDIEARGDDAEAAAAALAQLVEDKFGEEA